MKKFRLLKRVCAGALTVGMCLSLIACGTQSNSDDTSASGSTAGTGDKVKVGIAIQTLKANVYTMMQKSAVQKAEEMGVDLLFQSCELNAATQKNQIETMMGQGIDVLIIEPADADSMAATAQMVRDQGIKVINMEQRINGFDSDLWIVGDSYKVGQLQVEKFVEVWGTDKPAKMVLLCGTAGDEIAESISRGVRETAAKYDNIELVVDQQVAEWDRQKAMNYMEDAITKTGGAIDVVVANNDNMALGAYKAAENSGIADKMWFIGADNDEEFDNMILADKQFMTVDKGALIEGERLIEAANMLAIGEAPPFDTMDGEMPVWYTPVEMVQKDNIKEISGPKFPNLFK